MIFKGIPTIWNKKFSGKGEFYEPTSALGSPVLPSLDALPDVTADQGLRIDLSTQVLML